MKTFFLENQTTSSKCSWDFGNVVGEQNTFVFKTHFFSILAGEQPHFFFVKNTELFSNHTLFELKTQKNFVKTVEPVRAVALGLENWVKLSQKRSPPVSNESLSALKSVRRCYFSAFDNKNTDRHEHKTRAFFEFWRFSREMKFLKIIFCPFWNVECLNWTLGLG